MAAVERGRQAAGGGCDDEGRTSRRKGCWRREQAGPQRTSERVSLPGAGAGREAQTMFGPTREHANIVCKSSPCARCQILLNVRSSAAWRQWCKGSCVPRLAIGAVFACCAGVEVLWAHVLSVGLRGQRPLACSLTSTTLARPAKLRFHGRANKCSLVERVPENLQ
jgi:hypothetical protein